MKVSVLGCGNVGVALSADLSLSGHRVSLIKTTNTRKSVYDKIVSNNNRVILKEKGEYKTAIIDVVSQDLSAIRNADVVFVTIQSTYHEDLIKEISKFLNERQIVVCICSYMSSFYFRKYCNNIPTVVETTGPYLEGRIEENDIEGEIVFRVGCRLTRSPLSISYTYNSSACLQKIRHLYRGFSDDYSVIESGLLNPNMVLHTVGSIMSIPRIEYSGGNFCMYREAYAQSNSATLKIMLGLDDEKKNVLKALNYEPIDIFVAGGFLGDPLKSFYEYSSSSDRAISPTSVHSRYITEDVSQGLVLLESIAKRIGVETPITTSLIDIASCALGENFREQGRTIERLGCQEYIDALCS